MSFKLREPPLHDRLVAEASQRLDAMGDSQMVTEWLSRLLATVQAMGQRMQQLAADAWSNVLQNLMRHEGGASASPAAHVSGLGGRMQQAIDKARTEDAIVQGQASAMHVEGRPIGQGLRQADRQQGVTVAVLSTDSWIPPFLMHQVQKVVKPWGAGGRKPEVESIAPVNKRNA